MTEPRYTEKQLEEWLGLYTAPDHQEVWSGLGLDVAALARQLLDTIRAARPIVRVPTLTQELELQLIVIKPETDALRAVLPKEEDS